VPGSVLIIGSINEQQILLKNFYSERGGRKQIYSVVDDNMSVRENKVE
jgi:hypothetical protein